MSLPAPDLLARVPDPWRGRLDRLGRRAAAQGVTAALVGGCVRDLILAVPPQDWDVVVEGRAGPLVRALAKEEGAVVRAHPAFLTFTLDYPDGTSLDVATARREIYAAPARLPQVTPASLTEDAARRDFTVNALYLLLAPRPGELRDPVHGGTDLRDGVLRILHAASFVDDPTRLYRAARYAGRYAWRVEGETLSLIRRAVAEDRPAALSPVRRRNELFHLLAERDPVPGLSLLWDWGVWKYWDAGWSWNEERRDALHAASAGLIERLAVLLRPRPDRAEAWLKSTATPVDLRRRVLEAVGGNPRGVSGQKS